MPYRGAADAKLDLNANDVGDVGDVDDVGDVGAFGVVDKPRAAHNVDVEEYVQPSS